jgi:hypothetical protein
MADWVQWDHPQRYHLSWRCACVFGQLDAHHTAQSPSIVSPAFHVIRQSPVSTWLFISTQYCTVSLTYCALCSFLGIIIMGSTVMCTTLFFDVSSPRGALNRSDRRSPIGHMLFISIYSRFAFYTTSVVLIDLGFGRNTCDGSRVSSRRERVCLEGARLVLSWFHGATCSEEGVNACCA